ncbi:helix-turn-helix domain-containing protein [Luteibacter sp.]|uniref:helix-turn-helix domain-containing protein n=1 Tax=Luteibacter sp. TaxID=1886636 RepID=UPI003F7D6E3A
MVRSSSMPDQAPLPQAGITCLPLDRIQDVTPDHAGLRVFVLPGPCVIQREVAGLWLDVRVMYRGGIVVTRLPGPLRVTGHREPEGVVLGIDAGLAEHRFDALVARLDKAAVLQLDADSVIDSLVHVLSTASRVFAPCVREPIVEAISLRLAVLSRRDSVLPPSRQLPLPTWRLRRVTELVSERLDGAIGLADMAKAAGLSPMHFAAQFRAATGMRPHHYLLAQRIDRAKHLREKTSDTIMDIAIAVGFQTQGHFATVFKQHESVTPREWRGARGMRAQTAHRVRTSVQTRRGGDLPAETSRRSRRV